MQGRIFAVLAAAVALSACGPTTKQVSENARAAMQEKFDGDGNYAMYKLQVVGVTLVNTTGNEYRGVATIKYPFANVQRDIPIEVTADRENTMWKMDGRAVHALIGN